MRGMRSAFLLEGAGKTTLVPRADQTAPLCGVPGRFWPRLFFLGARSLGG
jgi:hypothetical protein